jgi:hypothetical protein
LQRVGIHLREVCAIAAAKNDVATLQQVWVSVTAILWFQVLAIQQQMWMLSKCAGEDSDHSP